MRPEDKWPQGKEEVAPLLGLERIKSRLMGHEDRDGEVSALRARIRELEQERNLLLSLCARVCRDNELNTLIRSKEPEIWGELHSAITMAQGWDLNIPRGVEANG